MIHMLGQVMVYVEDQDKAAKFWTEKAGFTVIADDEGNYFGVLERANK